MAFLSFDNTTETQRNQAAEANFIVHVSWLPQHLQGALVETDAHFTMVDSGFPSDTFNIVCGAHLHEYNLKERIARVTAHFQNVQRPFCWWIGPTDSSSSLGCALEEAGLTADGGEIAMIADLKVVEEVPSGAIRVERVRTPEQVRDFARIVAANWTPPDAVVHDFYEVTAPLLLASDAPQWLYIAYQEGVPVASSEITLGGGVAGLYNVCTLEAHRRQGIGSSLVSYSLWQAREHGYRVAVLQASDAGQGIYARLGFHPTGVFTEYKSNTATSC